MYMRNLKIMGVAALFCLSSAAFADPTGGWRGTVQNDNKTYTVEARFASRSVEVRFPVNPGCKVKADYVKADGRDLLYKFGISEDGGKFCQDLMGETLEVRYTEGDDEMTISFTSNGKWSGTLNRDNSSS